MFKAVYFSALLILLSSNVVEARGCWKFWDCPEQTRLRVSESRFAFQHGVPTFSDQGNYIAGVEDTYKWRLKLRRWPLQSVWVTEVIRTTIFIEDRITGARQELLRSDTALAVNEVFYFEAANLLIYRNDSREAPGYFALSNDIDVFLFDTTLDGPFGDYETWFNLNISAFPSRDGSQVAKFQCAESRGDESEVIGLELGDFPLRPSRCYLSLLETSTGNELFAPIAFELSDIEEFEALHPGINQVNLLERQRLFWTDDNTLLVTDSLENAFEVSTSGDVQRLPNAQRCEGPSTGTSAVSADGEFVTINEDASAFWLIPGQGPFFVPFSCTIE